MDLLKNLDNMITAEELLDNIEIWNGVFFVHSKNAREAMIEFAKLHVEAALKEASENVNLKESSSEEINTNNISPFITADDNTIWIINKDSILNAYPLENIK
jgi:hypothetical protein